MVTGTSMGISRAGDIIDLGVEAGIIRKLGAFFSYGDIRLGQGREKSKEFLRGNPELANELELELRKTAESSRALTRPKAALPIQDDDEEDPE